MTDLTVSTHDSYPPEETSLIDRGLRESNDLAAPPDEVQPISCFVRTASGEVIGGAIGRWWGRCCELQKLWVKPEHRRQGIGACLVMAFEARALGHGCSSFYLDTFNFQAPSLYRSLGYEVACEHKGFPHAIVKFHMVKEIDTGGTAT